MTIFLDVVLQQHCIFAIDRQLIQN